MGGATVLVLCNLTPAALRGVMSAGMLLVASTAEGELSMLQVPDGAAPGERVTFPPLQGLGFNPDEGLAKRKVQKLLKDLHTDADGVVCSGTAPFTLAGGVVRSKLLNATVK
eukprot:NODE_3157_length_698_cov_301.149461_g2238_i0.p1 GENE.NODE_3157_length_698_cov_301.149461_g2238_i0~~NODE_3157_length_698_cov_301.149461_g2238_i0.p1  ORF type:complete len:122 (-),score=67.71 NODE_3157_length_698_cov_301.149461_g2238_i0:333-668(-)